MGNTNIVCSLCGDIGFTEKLFQCSKCLFRFQHTYCGNYYMDSSEAGGLCDWCMSEVKGSSQHTPPSKKHCARAAVGCSSSETTNRGSSDIHDSDTRSKSSARSSKHAVRRYKLLKDVLC